MDYLHESLTTPITKEVDVLVAGGGIAGIAAALAAARHGARVLLTERQFMLGGLATAGLVTIYLPLCDGCGHQVSYGLAEELFMASIRYGWEDRYPKPWLEGGSVEEKAATRFEVQYNPQLFAVTAERMLQEAGVTILYGASVCAVSLTGNRIDAAVIEHKSGREAVRARSYVDCTGDADLFHMAGAKTVLFGPGNILAAWHYFLTGGDYGLKLLGYAEVPEEDRTEETHALVSRRFTGVDGWELSEMMQLSHEQLRLEVERMREEKPDYVPVTMASIPQIRMTRRILGAATMNTSDDHRDHPDSIGLIGNWKKRGPIYAVPFGALYSGGEDGSQVRNLITAGRSISATDPMWDVTRVIPVCAVTGQAAGIAAAMTDDFGALSVPDLQAKLRADGVKLSLSELNLS